MTIHTYCAAGCGQPFLFPMGTPMLCDECERKGVTIPEPAPTLFGWDHDEYLDSDIDSAIERAVDQHAFDGETVSAGFTFEIEVSEFSVLPKGQYGVCTMPSGATVAEYVIEHFLEEVPEEMYDQLKRHSSDADVAAAFQAAVDLVASKTTYLLADRVVATHRFKITITDDHGHWDYEELT